MDDDKNTTDAKSLAVNLEIDFEKLPSYDNKQIDQLLAVLPDSIWKAGRTRDAAEDVLATAKHDLKVAMAQAHLVARAKKDLTSSDDRKAWAIVRPEVMKAEEDIIIADGKHKAAVLNAERLENWFTAVRKIASRQIEADKMTNVPAGGYYEQR